MKKLLFLLVALSVFATGCATTTVPSSSGTAHVKCTVTEQVGCLELDVLNVLWDNELMAGLDKPYPSEEERYRRVTELGPAFYRCFKAGECRAAKERSFVILMWNVDTSVSNDHLASYQLDGRTLTKVGVEDAWGITPPVFDPVSDLGKPQRVYRVKARGMSPIGTALQIPWSMITEKTYILICAEDDLTVYPNRITAKEGLWIPPEYLKGVIKQGRDGLIIPIISKK